MIRRNSKDRTGVTLIELLTVMVIISVLAAIVQPMLFNVIVKARAADVISDMQAIRLAAFTYQTDEQVWPAEVGSGVVPAGLGAYLPEGFDLVDDDYTLDYDNWGGTPFMTGVERGGQIHLGVRVAHTTSKPADSSRMAESVHPKPPG
jgi:prepilin-type N-terminal cleavage/methylation domain-containing protein